MEEWVGQLWHRCRQSLRRGGHAHAAMTLAEQQKELSLLFRACAGDPGLRLAGAPVLAHASPDLGWRHGDPHHAELAFSDEQALHLPSRIDLYPQRRHNRELYDWLTALCAVLPAHRRADWAQAQQSATLFLLTRYAGLAQSYERLVAAELQRRPPLTALPAAAQARERALRQALLQPGSVDHLPDSPFGHLPLPLWTAPVLPRPPSPATLPEQDDARAGQRQSGDDTRRASRREDAPRRHAGLLIFRPESIFSWSEYAAVEHEVQDNDDENLAAAADDLDVISLSRDGRSIAKAVRMQLDDAVSTATLTAPGTAVVSVPEWHYRQHRLLPQHCQISTRIGAMHGTGLMPEHLRGPQKRLQGQLARWLPERQRLRDRLDGDIDIDACILHRSRGERERIDCHQQWQRRQRDIACLMLVDHSLSTEASLTDHLSVIDVIRDSLLLFAESLDSLQDCFALYGFCSRQRQDVRISELKSFAQHYDQDVRRRIAGLQPTLYTRMGAALRHASDLLAQQQQRQRLLLLITDGKPNDCDGYEGRYGCEDTRHAVLAARQRGLHPFCITIDQEAGSYLPHIFGAQGYFLLRHAAELPQRLPLLYAHMTAPFR